MKNSLLLIILFSMPALASSDIQLEEEYLKGRHIKLNAQEKEAIAIAKQWRSHEASQKPIKGANGNVTYFFGKSQPVMLCSPLEVCVIRLEVGEAITTMQAGDTTRWQITPTIVGYKGQQRTEIVIKPTLTGLVTSLYVGTTRRSYNIKLKSTRHEFVPFMEFIYPETIESALASYHKKVEESRSNDTIDVVSEDDSSGLSFEKKHVTELDFDYDIAGDTTFTPTRVYNDGVRTIIQMDASIANTDLPSLLVLDAKNKRNLVNYRVINHRFIVDQVFNQAILIAGVGDSQEKVTITRTGYKNRLSNLSRDDETNE